MVGKLDGLASSPVLEMPVVLVLVMPGGMASSRRSWSVLPTGAIFLLQERLDYGRGVDDIFVRSLGSVRLDVGERIRQVLT